MFSNQFHSFQLLGCFDLAASFFNVFTQIKMFLELSVM